MPVYDKPMIYYPLSTLLLAGINEILIITTPHDQKSFQQLLGDGSRIGCRFKYVVQHEPNGLAQAFVLGEDFIGKDNVALVLGDNIFYGSGMSSLLQSNNTPDGGVVYAYHVSDPERYGVVEFDNNKTNTRHKGGKLAKSNNKKKYNGGQNTYNVATDTIKIGNMNEWKNMVNEIKRNINNDTFYQNIEERPELPSSLIITGAETEQTTVPQYEYDLEDDTENFFENVQLGGKRNYERKPITEKQYLKEKQAPRPNRRVSRHPRKDGTYAYYVKVAK